MAGRLRYKSFCTQKLNGLFLEALPDRLRESAEAATDAQWRGFVDAIGSLIDESNVCLLPDLARFLSCHPTVASISVVEPALLPIVDWLLASTSPAQLDRAFAGPHFISALFILSTASRDPEFDFSAFARPFCELLLSTAARSSEYSAALAISILTRFAESSLENLGVLETIEYSGRMIDIVSDPKSVDSRLFALFSLVPVLQAPDYVAVQRPLFEKIMHQVTFRSGPRDPVDYSVDCAVMYCCDVFIRTSPKCRSIAIQNRAIDFALFGLQAPHKLDGFSIQKFASRILMFIIALKIPEYTDLVFQRNIIKAMWLLLCQQADNESLIIGLRLLAFLAEQVPDSCRLIREHRLVPVVCRRLESSSARAKCEAVKALAALLENSDSAMEIGPCGGFRMMFESLCGIPADLAVRVVEALRRTRGRCAGFDAFISPEDALADLEMVVCDTSDELAEQIELAREMFERTVK
jgi:hypothetical protein